MAGPFDWLVQIPDKPSAQESRMSHLKAHLEYNKPQIAAGQLVMSGPTLAAQPKSADEIPTVTGSVLLLRAGSEDEVLSMLRNNPYATEGVWDVDQAAITPFRCAVRTPL